MKKYTNEQWQAMSEAQKINEIKDSMTSFNPIILPMSGSNQSENMKLERKAGAVCVIQYM